ncbi:MAG: molybdenum cofactor guanylyltransferase MobA [Campylobacterota bacterium]|nr:molybdenum cofactor guanylyltransferase MobA [Campylobacterota bacterium]
MVKDIPCVILAGGKSSRMGEDKSLLPFKNKSSMVEYQYDKLSKIFQNIYISSKTNKFNFNKSLNIIIDNEQNISSPMVALKTIFEKIEYEKIFIITVDTPLIEKNTILTILENSCNYDITIAKDRYKIHNLCGVFTKKIYLNILNLIKNNNHKINYLIKSSNHKILSFNNSNQFININKKEDYIKANNF